MKGLRKYLSPFAPDQSGAAAVLCEFHGLIIILDAGGCAGNICGFDEPRWFERKSAVFSAGLRDMDAILGRDDRLVAKLVDAAEKVEAGFAAVIGTPVPAVIGTDYQALKRMCEKKTDLPVLAVNTDGMELYDGGERKAYLELFKVFAREKLPVETGRVGILGMTPQDVSDLKAAEKIRELDKDVEIIFITNAPQYAIQGYKVNALDYMLKPISWFSFSESMGRALSRVKTSAREYITISLKGGKQKLDVSKICYVEVQDHLLIYHTTEGEYSTKGTMKDADSQFDPVKFFRCNRCYLVNLEYVENYVGSDVCVNGDVIQVSRSRRKPFLDALNEYLNEVGK